MKPDPRNGSGPTIYRIASEAGVSPATVSRVLNGTAGVSAAKRQRVEEVIEKHGYQPNLMARGLSGRRSNVIGFIMPDITNPYWGALFLGAEKRAIQLGYTLFLANTLNDNVRHATNLESRYLNAMRQKMVDGILICGGRVHEHTVIPEHRRELAEYLEKLPIVTVSGRMPGLDSPSVSCDEAAGIELMVNYLSSVKHRRIGFLGGIRGIEPTDTRIDALIRSLAERGVEYRSEWCVEGHGFDMDSGRQSMEALLQLREQPSAVICFNDLVAIGATYTAQRHGLNVPRDISIVGIDNIPLSEFIYPPITTVDLRAAEQGTLAVELLVDLLAGHASSIERVVSPRLVIRDSCSAPIDV